ncbi:MAG: hypothetical protein HY810_07780 [Candidatus Omnitrophica bacterium]|nr:hypothetical protein [Candidatus Omnitrophota bacterium]
MAKADIRRYRDRRQYLIVAVRKRRKKYGKRLLNTKAVLVNYADIANVLTH